MARCRPGSAVESPAAVRGAAVIGFDGSHGSIIVDIEFGLHRRIHRWRVWKTQLEDVSATPVDPDNSRVHVPRQFMRLVFELLDLNLIITLVGPLIERLEVGTVIICRGLSDLIYEPT